MSVRGEPAPFSTSRRIAFSSAAGMEIFFIYSNCASGCISSRSPVGVKVDTIAS
jgi:hypothetical protein